MKIKLLSAAVLLSAATLLAGSPRITFTRNVAATYDLAPAERVAVIYAIGDTERVNDFIVDFVDVVGRTGAYRVENASENNHHILRDEAALAALRREHPADAYLGVTAFTCRAR